MGNLANSEDPNVMQHAAAFHQDQHCLLCKGKNNLKMLRYQLLYALK